MVIYGNNSSIDSLPYIVKKSMEEIFPWKRISIEEEDNKRAFPYSVKNQYWQYSNGGFMVKCSCGAREQWKQDEERASISSEYSRMTY